MTRKPGAFAADRRKYYRIEMGDESPAWARRLRLWLFHPGFHCVAAYRLSEWAKRVTARRGRLAALPLKALAKPFDLYIKFQYHVQIEARIGPGLYIGHVGTIYIGQGEIGPNCSLNHNVTIGQGQSAEGDGVPSLGRDVWIGTGSTLYGRITVGDGVTLAAGSILSKSVPAHSLVAGNPARVLQRDYDNRNLFALPPEPPVETAG